MSAGFPKRPTGGVEALLARIKRIESTQRDVRSNLLSAAGLSLSSGVLRVLGSLVVEGDLSVPNGSITNDALAAPIAGGYGNESYGSSASPAPISTTATDYASATISVPSGFDTAYVIATSSLAAQGATVILLNTRIDGESGPTMSVIADASGWANGSANYAKVVTGLGASFTVASRAQAGVGGVTGMLTTSALVVFLRAS